MTPINREFFDFPDALPFAPPSLENEWRYGRIASDCRIFEDDNGRVIAVMRGRPDFPFDPLAKKATTHLEFTGLLLLVTSHPYDHHVVAGRPR